jgi:hypothetical protein
VQFEFLRGFTHILWANGGTAPYSRKGHDFLLPCQYSVPLPTSSDTIVPIARNNSFTPYQNTALSPRWMHPHLWVQWNINSNPKTQFKPVLAFLDEWHHSLWFPVLQCILEFKAPSPNIPTLALELSQEHGSDWYEFFDKSPITCLPLVWGNSGFNNWMASTILINEESVIGSNYVN